MATQTLTPRTAGARRASLPMADHWCAARPSSAAVALHGRWGYVHNFITSGAPALDQESPPTG